MSLGPLGRFVALGTLLFVAEGLLTSPAEPASTEPAPIVLTTATQRLLLQEAQDQLGRPLRGDEAEQALRAWEDETLLVDDARRLGLDADDPIIRRRLAEKMRYLLQDASPAQAPSDEDLERHRRDHEALFMVPPRLELTQRFFARAERGAALDKDARAALAKLQRGDKVPGDPHRVGPHLPLQTQRQLADSFGAPFARAILEAPLDQWSGPYSSSRGLHLVRVTRHEPARPARLDEMRTQIQASWRLTRRKAAMRAGIDRLRAQRGLPVRGEP